MRQTLLENNAIACYDRVIVNLSSAISQAYGVPHEACKAISETLTHMMYHVKTSAGISDGHYKHTIETPVHGIGQGAGWSGPVWTFHTDILVKIMNKQANGFSFDGPRSDMPRTGTVEGFVDDMNAAVNSWNSEITMEHLQAKLQHDTQKWTDLIHATGGKLELTKTYYQLYGWKHDEQGNFEPEHCELPNITVTCPETNVQKQIKTKVPEDAQVTLGVEVAPNNNQSEEIKRLRKKSEKILRGITAGQASKFAAGLAENHIYFPAMTYSFPVTMIPDITLKSIQEPATRTFLSLQGINPNFPRSVVYGPIELAGMAKKNLPCEQAVANIFTFLQQNRRKTEPGRATSINLAWVQQEAGTQKRFFEDTSTNLKYVNNGLIPQIRRSLDKAKCKIRSDEPQTGMRENDSFIMDHMIDRFPKAKLKIINNWRLYLQIEKVSDIATPDGKRIHSCWYQRFEDRVSKSTIRWPAQTPPATKYWTVWLAALKILAENQVLRTKLKNWTKARGETERKYEKYIDPSTNRVYEIRANETLVHETVLNDRRTLQLLEANPTDQVPTAIQPATCITNWTVKPPSDYCYAQPMGNHEPEWRKNLLHGEIKEISENHKQIIRDERNFKIASFAHKKEQWAYGWCIETSDGSIEDYGITPNHPNKGKFTSFAYGILAAASIIASTKNENLIECNIEIKSECAMVAKRLEMLSWTPAPINIAMKPGSDVAIAAINILRPAKIWCTRHVGEENVPSPRCIRIAVEKSQHPRIDNSEPTQYKLIKPGGPYILMNNQVITSGIKEAIRREIGRQNLETYIMKKNRWNQYTFNLVDWKNHKTAMRKLPKTDRRIIIRFIHRWMPTGAYVKRQANDHDARCPLCLGRNEGTNHFLQCRHATIIEKRDEMLKKLKKLTDDAGFPRLKWLTEAILLWTRNSNPPTLPLTHPHRQIHAEQQSIGWHNLTRGRMPKKLQIELTRHFNSLAHDDPVKQADRWITNYISITWKWIIESWRFRCDAQHGKIEGALLTPQIRLNQRIATCYAYKNNLTWHDRRQYQKTEQEMIEQPRDQQEAWLLIIEPLVEYHRNQVNNTLPGYHDIRQFFQN